jgi:hypothetical protein
MRSRSVPFPALAAAALILSVGCSSVHTAKSLHNLSLAPEGENVCHINGSVSGLYLLGAIPLITGNTSDPNSIFPAFFTNTASLDATAEMVSRQAQQRGATHILDTQSASRSLWIIPSFVLFWKTQTLSANAVNARTAGAGMGDSGTSDPFAAPRMQAGAPTPDGSRSAAAQRGQEILLERETASTADEMTIIWGAVAGREYEAYVSETGRVWTKCGVVRDGVANERRVMSFDPMPVRFAKIVAFTPTAPGGYSDIQLMFR